MGNIASVMNETIGSDLCIGLISRFLISKTKKKEIAKNSVLNTMQLFYLQKCFVRWDLQKCFVKWETLQQFGILLACTDDFKRNLW